MVERVGWAGVGALAALVVWVLVTLPELAHQYAYEWDSVQFALGAREWDVRRHQPHPMGFPIWILMLKILRPVMDPLPAQRVLSLGFALAGLWMLRLIVREKLGETAALVTTALVAWGPPVRMLAVAQSTYTVDFFGGGLAGWLAMKAWRGEARSAFLLPVVVALLGGVRSSTGTFLAPLVGLSLLVFLWRTRRQGVVAAGVVCAGAVVAAWLVPTLRVSGGWATLSRMANEMFSSGLRHSSMFHGATWRETQQMMELTTVWIALSTFGLLVSLAGLLLLRRMWKPVDGEKVERPATPLDKPLFYAAWAGPTLFSIYFIHGPKPGYHLLVLTAVATVASTLVWRAARTVALRERDWAAGVLAVGLAATLGVTLLPFDPLSHRHTNWFETFRAMPRVHDDIDANSAAVFRLVDERGPGAITLMYKTSFEGPNGRTLQYYRPRMMQAAPRRLGTRIVDGYDVLEGGEWKPMEAIPEPFKEVLLVLPAYDPEWSLRAKFPLMRRIHAGPFMHLWLAPYR